MTPPADQPSILIVEDDPMVLATLKVTLEREGFQVTTSSEPRKALQLVDDGDFAVIISDYRMPEMTGLEFLVECRRRRPYSSRILLTAVANLATVVEAINRGEICRFIAKPWLREELLAALRDAVQRHDLNAHNQALQAETARLNRELLAANKALAAKLSELESRQPA
jgi:DNA-binding NtrC family response regulator